MSMFELSLVCLLNYKPLYGFSEQDQHLQSFPFDTLVNVTDRECQSACPTLKRGAEDGKCSVTPNINSILSYAVTVCSFEL